MFSNSSHLQAVSYYDPHFIDTADGDHSCSGRPAVEITRSVNIDMDTGEVEIPADAR